MMIKLIKTIVKNGAKMEYTILVKDEAQAAELLKDSRFKKAESKAEIKTESKKDGK